MRTTAPDVLPIFRSDMQMRLLGLLLLQPERGWTLEELTSLVEAPQSSVHRELRRFLDAGVITRDDAQRPHRYQADRTSPAHGSLKTLLELTVGLPAALAQALEGEPGVLAAAIHGSWATGGQRAGSDVDVLVVTEGDRRTVQRAVRNAVRRVGRDADLSILSPVEMSELVRSRNPFIRKVLKGPRADLVGDLDGLTGGRTAA